MIWSQILSFKNNTFYGAINTPSDSFNIKKQLYNQRKQDLKTNETVANANLPVTVIWKNK